MKKSYKAASSVGTVALVLSGSVMAAMPSPDFDNWSVTGGTITSGACQTGYSCGSVLSDLGFFQRMVTNNSTNQVFFQTIITENNANASSGALDGLVFSDESFVATGNVNGIADKQRISETRNNNGSNAVDGVTTFRASTQLGAGWAGDKLLLTQYLQDDFDDFQTDFIFAQKGTGSDIYAKGMKITAYVPLEAKSVVNADRQDFVLVDLQGDFTSVDSGVVGGGKVTLPGVNSGDPDQVMTWVNDDTAGDNTGVDGDRIQAVWVGQDLTHIVGQKFGYSSYRNLTPATPQSIQTFSLTDLGPYVGAAPYGTTWDQAVWGDLQTKGTITNPPTVVFP